MTKGSYNSYKRKYSGTKYQIDHFPPNSSYKGTPYEKQLSYGQRPAFPLSTRRHQFQRGRGGFGSHASSTGNTFVSKRWNAQLRNEMMKGNFYGAMKMDLVDKLNTIRGSKRIGIYKKHLLRGVKYARRQKLITKAQQHDLQFNYIEK